MTDDASTQFLPAADNFNANLGQTVGQFAVALVEADAKAQQARVNVIQAMLVTEDGKPRPPIDFTAQVNGSDGMQLLKTDISVPVIAIAEQSAFMPEEATLVMDMSVASHAEDTTSLSAEAEGSGSVGVGFGPFQANVEISAKMSVSKDKKRSSDYTSTTHAELKMSRIPPPEGLAVVIDAINRTVTAGIEIQEAVTRDQIQKAAADAKVIAPAEKTGQGGGGGGGGGG